LPSRRLTDGVLPSTVSRIGKAGSGLTDVYGDLLKSQQFPFSRHRYSGQSAYPQPIGGSALLNNLNQLLNRRRIMSWADEEDIDQPSRPPFIPFARRTYPPTRSF
jgi:hypothetical protein